MRICHFSDWHGTLVDLPEAEIYTCTGDMLRNYLTFDSSGCGGYIDKRREVVHQGRYVRHHCLRDRFGSKDAPCVVVKGNHDFVNLYHWIGGEVYEIEDKPTVFEVLGLKFGGFRGVPYINGGWADELDPVGDRKLGSELPHGLDFLVTHAPPMGIRDQAVKYGEHYGLAGAANWITEESLREDCRFKAAFFGHVHEGFGFEARGEFQFSNAATGYLLYEYKDDTLVLLSSYRNAKL